MRFERRTFASLRKADGEMDIVKCNTTKSIFLKNIAVSLLDVISVQFYDRLDILEDGKLFEEGEIKNISHSYYINCVLLPDDKIIPPNYRKIASENPNVKIVQSKRNNEYYVFNSDIDEIVTCD